MTEIATRRTTSGRYPVYCQYMYVAVDCKYMLLTARKTTIDAIGATLQHNRTHNGKSSNAASFCTSIVVSAMITFQSFCYYRYRYILTARYSTRVR